MAARRASKSGPLGRVTLEKVRKELERGWPAGLTLLTGEDLYHLDLAQAALLQTLGRGDDSGFGLTVFGEESVAVSTAVSAARTAGMFAEQRVVLVRDVSALDGEPDAIEEYAAHPPADSHLIVRAPVLDLRRKLHKAIAARSRKLEFAVSQRPSPPEVQAIATEKGMTLARDAAEFLAEVCANDLYRVSAELDKARTWMGDDTKSRVTLDSLKEILTGSSTLSGWEVANAILSRDLAAGLSAVRRLVADGDEPLRILGGIAYKTRTAMQSLGRGGGGGPRYGGYRDSTPVAYSLREMLEFPSLLLEADRTLKSRAIAPVHVLETLVEKMTAVGRRPGRTRT